MKGGEIVEKTEYNNAGGKMGKDNRNFGQDVGGGLFLDFPWHWGFAEELSKV